MKTITTEPNQTIYDIATQWYGNPEAATEIVMLNPTLANDPAAAAAVGINTVTDRCFYFDLPIEAASQIVINPMSHLGRPNITRDINKTITTYGTNN